jgi:hypothetical protein
MKNMVKSDYTVTIFCCHWIAVNLKPLILHPEMGLLWEPLMIDEYGAFVE